MKYFFFICLILMIGCASARYFSSEEEKLYYEKCSSCHRVYQKSELTIEKWKEKLDEMALRAKLKNEEKEIILKFLLNDKESK